MEAQKLIEALIASANGVLYTLHDAKITGKFDLKHRTVKVALVLHNCEFMDEVDVRYCEFTQTVDLSKCHFHGAFNSGDADESYTQYRKDFICSDAIFEAGASFSGVRCDGSGSFPKAQFLSEEQVIAFTGASFGRQLDFSEAVFHGGTTFNALCCEGGVLSQDPVSE
jgi:uncharacterized protein YjbI with pentapeptide repeats